MSDYWNSTMIRDEATAKNALDLMTQAHTLLMDSLRLVQEKCSAEECSQYQAGMAHVLGRLFFLLMEPVYREHPSLAPDETPREFLDSWQEEPPGEGDI